MGEHLNGFGLVQTLKKTTAARGSRRGLQGSEMLRQQLDTALRAKASKHWSAPQELTWMRRRLGITMHPREMDVDDALVDCLSVGSAIDDFGFFGSTAEDTGVWVCCSDQRFELWSLALPPAEEDMMSEGPPRLMQFPDARPAVTELLRPFGGIGGGVAVHPERLPTSAAAGDDDMDASVEDEVSAILSVFLSNREPGRNVYLPPVSPWLRVLKAESALYRNTGP